MQLNAMILDRKLFSTLKTPSFLPYFPNIHPWSRQVEGGASSGFEAVIGSIVGRLRLVRVEVRDSTASLFGQSSDGARLGFLIKGVTGGLSLEGRGEDKELLAGVIEDVVRILES